MMRYVEAGFDRFLFLKKTYCKVLLGSVSSWLCGTGQKRYPETRRFNCYLLCFRETILLLFYFNNDEFRDNF